MSNRRQLASYTLREPRDFVLIEEGVLRSDFGAAFGLLAEVAACPSDVRATLLDLAGRAMNETISDEDIRAAAETCRAASWRCDGLSSDGGLVAGVAMMFLSGLSGVLKTSHQRRRVPQKGTAS